MHRFSAPVVAFSLVVVSLLTACPGDGGSAGPDMRKRVDARTMPGNTIIGQLCDSNHPCPKDAQGRDSQCLVVVNADKVGACMPACTEETSESDCDTILPGIHRCVGMPRNNSQVCMLFCDKDKLFGRECPRGWTCEAVPGADDKPYSMCRPPQTPLSPPDMAQ